MNAMVLSPTNCQVLKNTIESALTDKINDREMYMKGIDYSYYYEENE
jgi:cell filamentation protein